MPYQTWEHVAYIAVTHVHQSVGFAKRIQDRIVEARGQQDNELYHSEFRYGSLARDVRLPATVDVTDVTARYDKGVLEVSVPVMVKPEGTRIPIQDADAMPEQPPDQAG